MMPGSHLGFAAGEGSGLVTVRTATRVRALGMLSTKKSQEMAPEQGCSVKGSAAVFESTVQYDQILLDCRT